MTDVARDIVLVHGFWVTPRSWEDWIAHYEAKGYTVHAPAYPGFDVEVEALNADPTPVEDLRVDAIIDRFETLIKGLDQPPIIMGHSAGGAFTQLMLDHGYGACGVAINSAPTEGVRAVPLAQVKATWPVLKNPANHHKAVPFSFEQWKYAFTSTFPEDEARRLYERYHVPASGRILWNSVLANWEPGPEDVWVNYHNDERAPLLFLSGGEDHLMPPAIQASNAKHYKSKAVTEVKVYDGRSHLMPSEPGWEQIADDALEWALANIGVSHASVTHIGGPTVLVEVDGWRILTDPTFDPPGRTYHFGYGSASTKTHGPAIALVDVGPLDAILLTHDHHADNLDDAGRTLLPGAGVVVTTATGAKRLGGATRGLEPWATTLLEAAGKPPITITATPCRHGPPFSHPIVGDVVGFALSWEGLRHGAVWFSGDTVLYDGVRSVGARVDVGVAFLHMGEARFNLTGPVRYTMSARGAIELCDAVLPALAIPVHYEGWSHFREGREAIERELATAPPPVRSRFQFVTIGEPTTIEC